MDGGELLDRIVLLERDLRVAQRERAQFRDERDAWAGRVEDLEERVANLQTALNLARGLLQPHP